jgi:hypothetical protein
VGACARAWTRGVRSAVGGPRSSHVDDLDGRRTTTTISTTTTTTGFIHRSIDSSERADDDDDDDDDDDVASKQSHLIIRSDAARSLRARRRAY